MMPSLSIPPLNLATTASSAGKSGDATQGFGSTSGDFNVNYGNGVSQGGGLPITLIYVIAGIAGLLAWKKFT